MKQKDNHDCTYDTNSGGLDIHQKQITACAMVEQADGSIQTEHRQFGTFKRNRRALAEWAKSIAPDEVVMESTGIYWKSPYAALEHVGIYAKVVNARHVKNVPAAQSVNRWRHPARRSGQ